MMVSVVILTYNRRKMLARCLAGIVGGQDARPDEVVVVNAGKENVSDITAAFEGQGVAVKTVWAPNRSLADNRNVGVLASTGDLVAFVDDDCEVPSEWLSTVTAPFTGDTSVGSVACRNVDANPRKIAHRLEETLLWIEDFYNGKTTPYCLYFSTRNVCYDRRKLEEIGLFEGTYRRSYEDVIVGLRLHLRGYKNLWVPELEVPHFGRAGVWSVIRRLFEYGRDMRAGRHFFDNSKVSHLSKAGKSMLYVFLTTFLGPIKDAVRFRGKAHPAAIFVFSFIVKTLLNAGIIWERISETWSSRKRST